MLEEKKDELRISLINPRLHEEEDSELLTPKEEKELRKKLEEEMQKELEDALRKNVVVLSCRKKHILGRFRPGHWLCWASLHLTMLCHGSPLL